MPAMRIAGFNRSNNSARGESCDFRSNGHRQAIRDAGPANLRRHETTDARGDDDGIGDQICHL